MLSVRKNKILKPYLDEVEYETFMDNNPERYKKAWDDYFVMLDYLNDLENKKDNILIKTGLVVGFISAISYLLTVSI